MSGHTTGPLRIKQSPDRQDGEYDYAILDKDNATIGVAYGRAGFRVSGLRPAGANAKLWAAAPELLAALEGLMEMPMNKLADGVAQLDFARAAIAKAKGTP